MNAVCGPTTTACTDRRLEQRCCLDAHKKRPALGTEPSTGQSGVVIQSVSVPASRVLEAKNSAVKDHLLHRQLSGSV